MSTSCSTAAATSSGESAGDPLRNELAVPRPVDPEDDRIVLTPGGLISWRLQSRQPATCGGASSE